ncbi:MAG: 4-hydroxy-tetrahydrodipicolinate synthase [Syntrophales bacterium]|nr:4-hydroxy-tetrahydrodipicolinate synthase [Syntrophales bacterium]MDD5643328.1 4-hydroxy-tetrahydrodipicolinate synthase [Syntrophales bacterium]
MLKGAFTAIVTPFKNGQLDEEAYRQLIERQIEGGIHGLVPCGTTGESPTLSHAEHKRVVEICLDQVKKRVPVIAGSGSNSTAESLELTKHAQAAGADYALMITPYYNKPTQEGLFQHYKTIADATKIPIVVYNVPGRTSLNLLPETMARLATLPNIVGLKDATGDLKQGAKTLELCGDKITVLSGDDFTTFPLMCVGGKGVISVVSNVVPADMAGMCNAFFKGDLEGAKKLHYKMWPLTEAMFFETNPVPVKTAMKLLGKITGEVRQPLCPMSAANEEKLRSVMQKYGLI